MRKSVSYKQICVVIILYCRFAKTNFIFINERFIFYWCFSNLSLNHRKPSSSIVDCLIDVNSIILFKHFFFVQQPIYPTWPWTQIKKHILLNHLKPCWNSTLPSVIHWSLKRCRILFQIFNSYFFSFL